MSGGDVTAREARLKEAWRGLRADLITVAPRLQEPYPDDPRWTPWTRFVERGIDRMHAAVNDALAELEAAEARTARLTEALREIASYDEKRQDVGCRCGHKMAFCHAVNAATWCGGHPGASLARHALGECPPVCWVCIRNESLAASRKEQSE